MPRFNILPTQYLSGNVRIFHPEPPKSVSLESPAIEIMTDLKKTHVAHISPGVSIDSANLYMKQRGVRSLFVLNEDHILQGVITATDILGEKPLRFIQEHNVKHLDILVSDIMTPLNKLEAISIEEVQRARVGHIIACLRNAGRQHTLVIEKSQQVNPLICGIFSLTQIERQLGQAIPLTEIAKTFAEIEATVVSN